MDELSFSGIQTIKCCKCNTHIEFEPGKIEGTLKDENGVVLNK